MNAARLAAAREMAEAAIADAKRGTPGPWTATDFEIYPSEGGGGSLGACPNGCDGGCDDDPRAPIQCTRVTHATEVIADVYGLQQFAAEDGALIATMRTREPLLAACAVEMAEEIERLRLALIDARETLSDEAQRYGLGITRQRLYQVVDRISAALALGGKEG